MTYKELEELSEIKKSIELIRLELAEIVYIGAAPITDMPHSHKKSEPAWNILQKRLKIESKLDSKLDEYYNKLDKIGTYIDSISDITIQNIAIRRYILNQEWEKIAKEVNYSRFHCQRLLKNYLKNDRNIF